jgi:competence protein ComEC
LSGFINNPFIRILIPFITGILIYSENALNINVIFPLLISLGVLVLVFLKNKKRSAQQSKWVYLLVSDCFLFLTGFYCCYLYNIKNDQSYFGHYVNAEQQNWVGVIKDLPVEKEKFCKVLIEVRTIGQQQQLTGNVIVYLKKPVDLSILEPGNYFRIQSNFIQPKPPLNPHEFDYKTFLERKNIYYQSFVDPENFELTNKEKNFSLLNFGLSIKQKVKTCFETSGLNKEIAQLCTALLTGYDDEINPDTINAFAHSGTLHVLSVSGLHTGILYAVLIFLLGWIDKHGKHQFIQLIIISLALWSFALITGFSPPVLRAVIMLNLIAIGRAYYSYSTQHSVNILAVSAFLILIVDPLLVYDTGFLLSYSAVLGILYFEPLFTPLVNSRYRPVNKIWQLTSVSLAAQISTLPLTLFLFHQFPLWFVFSNLVVIPLCTIIMFLGIILLFKLNFIVPLINLCGSVIFYCIHLTDKQGAGYIDTIDFGWRDLFFLTALIFGIILFMKQRIYIYLAGAAVLLILWQLSSLSEISEKRSASHIGIYHVNKQMAVDIKNANVVRFSSTLSGSNYNYHIKPNHTFYNYPSIDSLKFDLVRWGNTTLFKLNSSDQQILLPIVKPDYLLVSNNSSLAEAFLPGKIKMIVADGTNNYKNVKELRMLCDKFAIPFYSTAEKGYIQFNL